MDRIRIRTDYPVFGSGDHSVKEGFAWAWDRDKYVQVSINDELFWVKRGYVVRASDGKPLTDLQYAMLPRSGTGSTTRPSRRDAHREVKAIRREHRTTYSVYMGYEWGKRRPFGNVRDAVSFLAHQGQPGWALCMDRRYKRGSSSGEIASIDDAGQVVISVYGRKRAADLSARQIRRLMQIRS
jgi:hypothetical protein